MKDYVSRFENEKYRLSIYQDYDNESPRTWSNLGNMVCWSRDYNLGDKHDYEDGEDFFRSLAEDLGIDTTYELYDEDLEDSYDEDREIEDIRKEVIEKVVILPLFLYDHSGLSMRTYTHGYHSSWDCGQVGYIYVTHENIIKEYGALTDGNIKKATDCLEGEVEIYSQYLEGDIYGFILEQKILCEHCSHIEYKDIDSCWGFYGYNLKENGILDDVDLSKEEIEDLIKEEHMEAV